MGPVVIFSLVLSVVVGPCAGIELYSHLDVYDDIYIRQVSGRVRRSLTEVTKDDLDSEFPDHLDPGSTGDDAPGAGFEFPETMTFTFTVKQTKVHLDLKLNEHQGAHVPVNLITKTGIHLYHEENQRDYAYYQVLGDEAAAAVMVRCPDFTFPCHMTGQFSVGDETYLVEPNSDKPKLVSEMPHKVYKVQHSDSANYVGDTTITRTAARESTEQEGSDRRKRQAEGLNLIIELEMVIDYSLYTYWLDLHNGVVGQALSTIDEYYGQVANMMNLRFSTLSSSPGDMTFDIVPLEINVVTDSSVDTWIGNNLRTHTDGRILLDASLALQQFESWAANNQATLSKFDAIMAFTRHDLGRFSSDGTQATDSTLGLAHQWQDWQGQVISGLCNNGNNLPAASIVEDLSTGTTALTASHELAHNMGAGHDNVITACSDLQDYIMDAAQRASLDDSLAANPWTFSPCSKATLQDTTNRLLGSGKTCLLENTYDVMEYKHVQNSLLLGEIYSIEDQCVLREGVGSRRCTFSWEGEPATICHSGIYCLIPGTNQCAASGVMPGTPCGTGNMKCIQGTCQSYCNWDCRLRKFLDYLRQMKRGR